MFKQQAKQITQDNQAIWESSLYFQFLKTANREELLKSQVPFYHAVDAFPKMLLNLASRIQNPYARLLIVDNIWEEHGQGDTEKFHINTFNAHLNALGFKGTYFHSPFINDWIDNYLKSHDKRFLFHALAAIEYIYAVISETIANKLAQTALLGEQTHYSKHSKLDWSHGEEILMAMEKEGIDFDAELFCREQRTFIHVLSTLSLPTTEEIIHLNEQMPVNFYHTRESSAVLTKIIDDIARDGISVLTVCSGGEHVIEHLANEKVASVLAFDINEAQLEVCRKKMSGQQALPEGKFEYLFQFVRNVFTNSEGELHIRWALQGDFRHMDYVIDNVFSTEVLTAIFGPKATRYSQGVFSEHFKQVYRKMASDIESERNILNSKNVILGTPLPPAMLGDAAQTKLTLVCKDAKQAVSEGRYDFIDLSNIGDWMPLNEFVEITHSAFERLNEGGRMVMRRLLGDYILQDISMGTVIPLDDNTGFYSEMVVFEK
ncbi:hypothetical protein CS022_02925 [Veronia nyctiphanis]|uniref:Uncharacterized protein n=1 Tax=Veronia nyctiphanis TaxID=1278244 RepID=A0A4Q0YUR0_9GAMM|nr:iron-containing redox enzyme family protein [Veronia nyctiphanis]RXJ74543.1 hypothetical protein CS022_02925 [Veronia nyctiphanis]